MHAAAVRYSGNFADPLDPGRTLPRVRAWQIWNEPNLQTYLAPQWVPNGGGWAAESPNIYRDLLNAGYDALKGVRSDNFVVSAGTAPYGDLDPGGRRIPPVEFLRDVFAKPTRLDAISHHPYGVGDPLRHALNDDDAAVPDIGKLARVLRKAEKKGTALPRGHKRIWVTEISWDSSPPDPQGVPAAQHARWTAQGLYVLWKQGVDTITWFQIRDSAPEPSYAATNQSGVFFRDGTPKLSATAFRFPFVAWRSGKQIAFWGRSPKPGRVAIQGLRGSRWVPAGTARPDRSGVFQGRVKGRWRSLRAVGPASSLPWGLSPI
jgi:hypothetical protein